MTCELWGFVINCEGETQTHHIINKSQLRGNARALKYVEAHPVLLAQVCVAHNVGRLADTKQARALLLRKRVALYGESYMDAVLGGLRACFRGDRPELRLSALIG